MRPAEKEVLEEFVRTHIEGSKECVLRSSCAQLLAMKIKALLNENQRLSRFIKENLLS